MFAEYSCYLVCRFAGLFGDRSRENDHCEIGILSVAGSPSSLDHQHRPLASVSQQIRYCYWQSSQRERSRQHWCSSGRKGTRIAHSPSFETLPKRTMKGPPGHRFDWMTFRFKSSNPSILLGRDPLVEADAGNEGCLIAASVIGDQSRRSIPRRSCGLASRSSQNTLSSAQIAGHRARILLCVN